MNIPNQLTCIRIALTVLFVWFFLSGGALFQWLALLTFIAASATDYWDGRIARRSGQITPFGKLMDPIADKLLTFSAFAIFAYLKLIPLWMVLAVVARDLIVTIWRLALPAEGDARAARASGKRKTAIQFMFVVMVLIHVPLAEAGLWPDAWMPATRRAIEWSMLAITILTLWSGVQVLGKSGKP